MFLDIGIGLIVSKLLIKEINIDFAGIFIILGVVFSLLPDIDFIFQIFRKRGSYRFDHEHRNILHYPIVYLFLGTLALLVINKNISILFFVVSLIHFLHDSMGISWGIKWLYPFSKKNIKFLNRNQTKEGKYLPREIISVWSDREVKENAEKFGKENWFKKIYLKPSIYASVEYLIFAIGLIFLFGY